MTDTPPEGFLSPSFAPVIAFGDLPQHENSALDELEPRARELNPTARITTEQLGEALDGREGKQYPRLELDPTMDKYHTLDGFAEPKNPQNTPASNSGCDSPHDAPRRDNGEGLRTSSAPAIPALTINWFEDPPDEDSIYLPGDAEDSTKNQTRRFSADDKPRSPRPVNRPLPSVERKQDYIATYRQQKQNEKWKSLNRARAQGVSPNRSPARASQPSSNPLSGQPGIRFSSPSKSAFGDDQSRLTSLFQSSSDQEAPEMSGALTDESAVTKEFAPSGQACDLAVISFSLYRFRYPGSSRAGVLQVRMNSTIIPLKPSLQEGKTNKTVVTRMAVDDLLLHTYVVVPAFILRLPLIGVSAAKQFKHSRFALAAIHLWKIFWVLALRALYFVMLKLGQDVYYYSKPRPPCQKKRRSA